MALTPQQLEQHLERGMKGLRARAALSPTGGVDVNLEYAMFGGTYEEHIPLRGEVLTDPAYQVLPALDRLLREIAYGVLSCAEPAGNA